MSAASGAPAGVRVVVVACRRPQPLRELLAGLAGGGFEVVVVNVGADAAVDAVVAGFPDVRVLAVENRGYAAAVNAGARGAAGPVTVFMNEDLLVAPQALLLLVDAVAGGSADVAVPRLIDLGGRDEGTLRALPTPWRLALEWALLPDRPPSGPRWRYVRKWRRPTAPEPIEAATAALVAVRSDLLAAEPLPEAYFLYWEELEWFWRLRGRGARVLFLPAAAARHEAGSGAVRPAGARLLARNAVRCVRRTQGRRAALATLPAVVFWQLRLLALDALRAPLAAAARRRLPARLAGSAAALGAWREVC